MDLENFWQIIDESRMCSEANAQLDFIKGRLQELSDKEVLDFDRILKQELLSESHLYLLSLAFAAIYNANWTDDTFDHLKAWLVLQGRDSFASVCQNPDELASYEKVRECEPLLTIGDSEWRRRHGSPSPILVTRCPQREESQTQDQIEKLIFDDLEHIFPRLFRKSKPMRELQWHPKDRQLMHLLTDQGAKLDQLHTVDHFFICPNRESADNIVRDLQVFGHSSKVMQIGFRKWQVHSVESTTLLSLTRRTQKLMDLAEKYQTSYDGWGGRMSE